MLKLAKCCRDFGSCCQQSFKITAKALQASSTLEARWCSPLQDHCSEEKSWQLLQSKALSKVSKTHWVMRSRETLSYAEVKGLQFHKSRWLGAMGDVLLTTLGLFTVNLCDFHLP